MFLSVKRIITLCITILFCFAMTAYSDWPEHKSIRYLDMDGDLTPEIILESRQGAGTGHYVEDMRIFKDDYPTLELIFTVITLHRYFGFDNPIYNCDIVSAVEFTEQTVENKGIRAIIVKTKKIYYKDEERKIVEKEENVGTKIFKWDGVKFAETNPSIMVPSSK